jgi:hypothetical protein
MMQQMQRSGRQMMQQQRMLLLRAQVAHALCQGSSRKYTNAMTEQRNTSFQMGEHESVIHAR